MTKDEFLAHPAVVHQRIALEQVDLNAGALRFDEETGDQVLSLCDLFFGKQAGVNNDYFSVELFDFLSAELKLEVSMGFCAEIFVNACDGRAGLRFTNPGASPIEIRPVGSILGRKVFDVSLVEMKLGATVGEINLPQAAQNLVSPNGTWCHEIDLPEIVGGIGDVNMCVHYTDLAFRENAAWICPRVTMTLGDNIKLFDLDYKDITAVFSAINSLVGDDRVIEPVSCRTEKCECVQLAYDNVCKFASDGIAEFIETRVVDTFKGLDTDRTAGIDQLEYETGLARMGVVLPKEDMETAFKSIDTDNDGYLQIKEYNSFAASQEEALDDGTLEQNAGKKGVSGGAVAGIAIGCLAVGLAAAAAVFLVMRKKAAGPAVAAAKKPVGSAGGAQRL